MIDLPEKAQARRESEDDTLWRSALNDGRNQGIQQGIEQGIQQAAAGVAAAMRTLGFDAEAIAYVRAMAAADHTEVSQEDTTDSD